MRNYLLLFFFSNFSYSEEVFSQHSRRHSNDTNSDLSEDEIFMPDDMKSGIRRQSKAGEILASPTHRKLTPTHIRSSNSSPVKRLWKLNQNESKSLDRIEMPASSVDEVHQYYNNIIENLKRTQEEKIKQLKYKIQMHEENIDADDEYLVSRKKCFALISIILPK